MNLSACKKKELEPVETNLKTTVEVNQVEANQTEVSQVETSQAEVVQAETTEQQSVEESSPSEGESIQVEESDEAVVEVEAETEVEVEAVTEAEVEVKAETEEQEEQEEQEEVQVQEQTQVQEEAQAQAQAQAQEQEAAIKIQGKVGSELTLTLDELKSMEELIFEADYFSLNSFGTKGYTHFKGVNLWRLLKEKAAISEDAVSVTIIATDGYQISFSLEQIQRQDYMDEQNPDNLYPIIISWEENGIELDPSEGAPFKLAVGQKEAGDVNKPQWVSQIDRILVD